MSIRLQVSLEFVESYMGLWMRGRRGRPYLGYTDEQYPGDASGAVRPRHYISQENKEFDHG